MFGIGRDKLFVRIKDNNAGKELRTVTIPLPICNTIVETHAAAADGKILRRRVMRKVRPRTVKAHEVGAVRSLIKIISKVDLQV